MFQPTTTAIGAESAQPERETVIKFVISGPFLNAEAARTQWTAEPSGSTDMLELLKRIAELERKLDDERAQVEELRRLMPALHAPAAMPDLPAPAPDLVPTSHPAQPVAKTIAAPAPPRLSTVARTPPPKVRGLRRMIGALRRL